MEKSSKRGKIPQQDWPLIIKRYESGETLASIARTYGCSPPAISYILTRSRARDATAEGAEPSGIESPEPQLVKGRPTDLAAREFINGAPEMGEAAGLPPTAQAPDPEPVSAAPASVSNGAAGGSAEFGVTEEIAVTEILGRPAQRDMHASAQATVPGNGNSSGVFGTPSPQPQPGEQRRTLHLSLSHNNAQPMEVPHRDGRVADMADTSAVRPVADQEQELTRHSGWHHPAPNAAAKNGGPATSMVEPHKRDGGTFIDRALRERVDGDIAAFLAAFDAALAEDTIESRAELREATDRLLRAGARTRIELERLEARLPLSARDRSGYSPPTWRPR
jgi:hypothetical protein